MIYLIALIILLLWILYQYLTQTFNHWKKRGIDFVPPQLFFGNFKDVLLGRINISTFVHQIYKSSKSNMVGGWAFRQPILIIRSPELVKRILIQDFNKFPDRILNTSDSSGGITERMMFFCEINKWRDLRQQFSPVFTLSKLKNMVSLISKNCLDATEYISNQDSNIIECKEFCCKFTTDVIASVSFGVDANSLKNHEAEFREIGRRLIDTNVSNATRQWLYFFAPYIVKLFKIDLFDSTAVKYFKQLYLNAMQLRENSGVERNDLMDAILKFKAKALDNGENFDLEDMVAQSVLFYAAGFETTSSTIAYALYEMALNEDVQIKVRKDVQSVYKECGEINYESVMKMNYLNMVVMETLRKYPVLAILTRTCVEDYPVIETGNVIEKGTNVYISLLGFHHNEDYYPDPEKFDPERFSESNLGTKPDIYMPFSLGPRNCIGDRLGLLVVKLCLAHILMKYKMDKCPQTPKKIEFNSLILVLQSISGIPIKFTKLMDDAEVDVQ